MHRAPLGGAGRTGDGKTDKAQPNRSALDPQSDRPAAAPALPGGGNRPDNPSAPAASRRSGTGHEILDQFDELFCGLWPSELRALFDPDDPKPLAIGIRGQIGDALGLDDAEQRRLANLLGRWTGRSRYLKSLRNREAMRHGVDGRPVGPVSPDHAIFASRKLHATSKKAERRKAQAAAEQAARERTHRANAGKPTLRLGGRR